MCSLFHKWNVLLSILVLKVAMLDVFNTIEIHFLHLLLTKMCRSNSANNTELSMIILDYSRNYSIAIQIIAIQIILDYDNVENTGESVPN